MHTRHCLAVGFVLLFMLTSPILHAGEVGLTGQQPANQAFVRNYGTGTPVVNDVVGELRQATMKNDVPMTNMALRTTVTNATTGAEQSLVSLFTLNGGVLGSVLNILGNKVGIGTSNPAKTLDVSGTFATSGKVTLNGVVNNVNSSDVASKGYHLWTRDETRMDNLDINIIKYTYGDRTPQFAWDSGNVGHSFLYRARASAMLFDFDRVDGTYAAPTQLVDGDSIVQMNASGRNPNGTHTVSTFLSVQVNGTPSGTTLPMSLNIGPHMNVGVGVSTPKNKLDVEGAVSIGNAYSGTNTAPANGLIVEGSVGVGTSSPQAKLHVNGGNVLVQGGNLMLTDLASAPTAAAGRSGLYSLEYQGTSELYAIDGAGNSTRLSSHAEPPVGFDPPSIDSLPWSINHANSFIGRGQIVNMSKLVRLVEELTGNQLAYDYDLPADWKVDFEKWKTAQVEELRKEYIQRDLDNQPRVEVGADEAILRIPKDNGEQAEPILKSGYQHDKETGRFYRTRQAKDVKVPDIAPPDLPDWIKMRIGSKAVNRDLNSAQTSKISKTICSSESQVTGDASAILGGCGSLLAGDGSVIIGGNLNAVVADGAAVIGGSNNHAGGLGSVVLGGHNNTADGAASIVTGIRNNTEADLSFAGGANVNMTRTATGSFVWDNSPTTQTIETGNAFFIFPSGKGGAAIGTDTITTGTRLEVAGGDIRLTGGGLIVDGKRLAIPDYVFESNYQLMPIENLRDYISANKHLPGVPSRDELERNGLDVTQFQLRLLEKIEEQARYIVSQDEALKEQQSDIDELKAQVKMLMNRSN